MMLMLSGDADLAVYMYAQYLRGSRMYRRSAVTDAVLALSLLGIYGTHDAVVSVEAYRLATELEP